MTDPWHHGRRAGGEYEAVAEASLKRLRRETHTGGVLGGWTVAWHGTTPASP
jgi:hypothetical protein